MEQEIENLKKQIEVLEETIAKLRLENSNLENKLYSYYGKL